MTNEEWHLKMVTILEKHGLEYPAMDEEAVTAWPKIMAAFEFFDAEVKKLEDLTHTLELVKIVEGT